MFSLILFAAAGSFILPKTVLADEKEIVINEIYCDGKNDWIELYNQTDRDIDLVKEKYRIHKAKTSLSNSLVIRIGYDSDGSYPGGTVILAKGHYLIVRDDAEDKLRNISDAIGTKDSFTWDCSGYTFYLGTNAITEDLDPDIVDKVGYGNSIFCVDNQSPEITSKGSIARNDKSDNNNNKCSKLILEKEPTPTNSLGKILENPKSKEYSDKIKINEILPNPKGKDDGEFIELYNYSEKDVDLSGYILKDSSKKGEYEIPAETTIKSNSYLVIYKEKFKFALNNSNETIYLLDPNKKEIDEISFSESAKEGVSYNFDGEKYRWSKFLTPGKKNQFNNLPTSKLKIEKKVYKNMLAEFRVSAKDKDKDKLKFVWDFGDGHKSYKQNTTHKYLKKGVYQVSLKISDGSEDVFETFEIKVGSFPKEELKIVSVKANPRGKDTERETIKIKNNSKKKINLRGWSVATGWKELYNHPINKKFVLNPGEIKELTRKYSAFTLNNKQTKIELRRPDGSIASKVKYSKKEGIQDDETYEKTEGSWQWVESQTNTDSTRTDGEELENDATEKIQEILSDNSSDENNPEEQTENNTEIQVDEPAEEGEILGAETIKKNENISNNKPISGNFFQRIFWNANRFINNLINYSS